MVLFPSLQSQGNSCDYNVVDLDLIFQDLRNWIDGAGAEGVIYFCFGSIIKGKTLPKRYRDIFVEAFSKVKQRIVWKYEEEIEELPTNVLVRSWLPQQNILGIVGSSILI